MMKKVESHVFNTARWHNTCKVAEYGEGAYVYDSEGKCYLDAIEGTHVISIGHGVPEGAISNSTYFGFIVVQILAAILIIDIFLNSQSSFIGKILSNQWLVWLGKISYGLYLWHYPIYRAMRELSCSIIFVVTIGSLVGIIISTISYYYLESPILKLKKKFIKV